LPASPQGAGALGVPVVDAEEVDVDAGGARVQVGLQGREELHTGVGVEPPAQGDGDRSLGRHRDVGRDGRVGSGGHAGHPCMPTREDPKREVAIT
jgi:hypothetical protein